MADLVRPPATVFDHSILPLPDGPFIKHMAIHHPYYDDQRAAFLSRIPCFDTRADLTPSEGGMLTTDEEIEKYEEWAGVHRGTMTLVCYALTGGKHGILSTRRFKGTRELKAELKRVEKSELGYDEVLTADMYFFYPVDYFKNPQYEVFKRFEDWKLPMMREMEDHPILKTWEAVYVHDLSRRRWARNSESRKERNYPLEYLNDAVKYRDEKCLLTGSSGPLDIAYIVPRGMCDKFWANCLASYSKTMGRGKGHTVADRARVEDNMLSLRRDVQYVFDKGDFCITVKERALVANFVSRRHIDTARALHNCQVRTLSVVRLPFLLARLGWTFFQKLDRGFLTLQELYRDDFPVESEEEDNQGGTSVGKGQEGNQDSSSMAREREECRGDSSLGIQQNGNGDEPMMDVEQNEARDELSIDNGDYGSEGQGGEVVTRKRKRKKKKGGSRK
ncbi:hypothetical protein TWF696_003231 [Orbilia brochopaga]|uniref:HNH nuclease domain-containing protein n=1 Tax=Orbilia brochopaga TaxID=3140254 RepID=A0AAV9TZF9_9PEZI